MYIKTASITNVRSIASLVWQLQDNQAPGWHVILGDNGAGKSTFIRSIALALIGPNEAQHLLEQWKQWLKRDAETGRIEINLLHDEQIDKVRSPDTDEANRVRAMITSFQATHEAMLQIVEDRVYKFPSATILLRRFPDDYVSLGWEQSSLDRHDPAYNVWGRQDGWFSVAYGPLRRFSGGDAKYDAVLNANPKLARYLSALDESVALPESLRWLKDLQFKRLEGNPKGGFLSTLRDFVNQPGFLPHDVQLGEISSTEVQFTDGNGVTVPVEDLSDGYRSVLSLTFDLLRQLQLAYGWDNVFDPIHPTKVIVPGVVLIDEVDAHLHPTWQQRIGVWFRKHFPNIQFIVTTHSPLVCQAATTVFKLPTPGTNEQGQMICGAELNRLLYGNILEAYSTEVFGSGITRSETSRQRTRRLAELNRKELHGELTAEEEKEQDELRAMLPTTAHIMNEEATV